MIRGSNDTFWIDTPGFRDFALIEISEEERNLVFPEISQLAAECHFRNCTHTHEDGCQVLNALREKKIKRERYDAYQKMVDTKTIPYTVSKTDYRHSACVESFTYKVIEDEVDGKFIPVGEDVLKTKSSFRTLPLLPSVEKMLLVEKGKQAMYRRLFKRFYCREYLDYICLDQTGKLLRPNYATEHFGWLLEKF